MPGAVRVEAPLAGELLLALVVGAPLARADVVPLGEELELVGGVGGLADKSPVVVAEGGAVLRADGRLDVSAAALLALALESFVHNFASAAATKRNLFC